MALTWDQVSAITSKKFIPKLVDNIFDSSALLARMKTKGKITLLDGGVSIMQPLEYALNGAAGWYAGSDTLDTTDTQNLTAAEYQWKFAYANVSVQRTEELKNSGDSQIISLVKSKMKNAEKTLRDYLGDGIYSDGSNSKAIVGLRSIINTSATVGGISQSTYSWWAAQLDSTTTTLTLSAMQTLFNLASIEDESPTVGVATRAIYNLYYALLQPQQRFQDSESAKGGFSSLMFNGIPIISDAKCPTANLMFINENYLDLYTHRDENFRFEDFQKPVNQNVRIAKIYWAGALASSNNRKHARLSAITA
jgi:hypothetical protein